MSKMQLLRMYVNQRLSMAVEEIIRMFEKTISEYEQEIDRQRRMLGGEQLSDFRIMLSSDTGVSQEIRLLLQGAKIPPKKLSPSLDPDSPEAAHIKEEPEEVYIRQGLQGAAVPQLQFPPVFVKSEDDEVKLESSLPHQRQTEEIRETGPAARSPAQETEAARENCGKLEPAFDLNVAGFLKDTSNGQHFLAPFLDTLKDTEALKSSPNQKKIYKCPACSKTFKHNAALQKHITCHTGESPYRCAECGKTFRQKGSLQIHMRKHTGERPFSCLVCGKNFTQGGTLPVVAHMRIHTGEKPFSCTVCKKRYSVRGTLFKHMRVHTGEKPFACSLCGKRFSEKGNLKKNERIHTGEKPFSYSACEKRFSLLSNLKNHKCSRKKSSGTLDQAPQPSCPNVTVQLPSQQESPVTRTHCCASLQH